MNIAHINTLSKNLPDVLAALLKRMPPLERQQILTEFEEKHPTEFKQWYRPDVKKYLQGYGRCA